eukprot:scaffold120327_cov44-Phaeocystis_antarctica.AAC.2
MGLRVGRVGHRSAEDDAKDLVVVVRLRRDELGARLDVAVGGALDRVLVHHLHLDQLEAWVRRRLRREDRRDGRGRHRLDQPRAPGVGGAPTERRASSCIADRADQGDAYHLYENGARPGNACCSSRRTSRSIPSPCR